MIEIITALIKILILSAILFPSLVGYWLFLCSLNWLWHKLKKENVSFDDVC
ncbi:hypothetical protein MJ1HA_0063 [Metallosphaera sedula]|nr:hypothetical protein MJ1HA_0063 [Metallosphaera sedula]